MPTPKEPPRPPCAGAAEATEPDPGADALELKPPQRSRAALRSEALPPPALCAAPFGATELANTDWPLLLRVTPAVAPATRAANRASGLAEEETTLAELPEPPALVAPRELLRWPAPVEPLPLCPRPLVALLEPPLVEPEEPRVEPEEPLVEPEEPLVEPEDPPETEPPEPPETEPPEEPEIEPPEVPAEEPPEEPPEVPPEVPPELPPVEGLSAGGAVPPPPPPPVPPLGGGAAEGGGGEGVDGIPTPPGEQAHAKLVPTTAAPSTAITDMTPLRARLFI